MAIKNREEAIRIIRNDAQIKCQYINSFGETCAIGGLGKATGFDLSRFMTILGNTQSISASPKDYTKSEEIVPLVNLASHLREYFGFTASQLRYIQIINDETTNRSERQQKIIKYIEGLK